jgi:hypothetical protein
MNPEQPQISGLPLPQSITPAGAYSFAAQPVQQGSPGVPDQLPPPGAVPLASAPTAPVHASMAVPLPVIVATDTNDSDDTDEADEAWVAKAREVIDQTRDDPYTQTHALARLRADYLKSRFNRETKMNEDAAR